MKLCAGLLLVRPTASLFEILLIKRQSHLSVFAGAYVCPGGISEKVDQHQDWFSLLNMKKEFVPGNAFADEIELNSLKITALRETCEEVGILISDKGVIECEKNYDNFAQCIGDNLYPGVDQMSYFIRFLTPEVMDSRFDVVFFMSAVEGSEKITLDTRESSEYIWGSPLYFLNKYEQGEILIFPPQVYFLKILSKFPSISALLVFEFHRTPLLAQISSKDNALFYPGDFRHKYTEKHVKSLMCRHELRLSPVEMIIDKRLKFS